MADQKELGPKTASGVFSCFKIIMKSANNEYHISTSMSSKVTIVASKRHRRRPGFFQMEEVNAALSVSPMLGPRHAAFAHLFWLHGLRSSGGRGTALKGYKVREGDSYHFSESGPVAYPRTTEV